MGMGILVSLRVFKVGEKVFAFHHIPYLRRQTCGTKIAQTHEGKEECNKRKRLYSIHLHYTTI